MTSNRRRSILTDSENPNPYGNDASEPNRDTSLCAAAGCPLPGVLSKSLQGPHHWYCRVHDSLPGSPQAATERIHGMRERMLVALREHDQTAFAIMVRFCRGESTPRDDHSLSLALRSSPVVDSWAKASGLVGNSDQ